MDVAIASRCACRHGRNGVERGQGLRDEALRVQVAQEHVIIYPYDPQITSDEKPKRQRGR